MAKNPYETLGVDSKASQDDIKAAYRKLAKQFHPDLNPGNKKAENRFKDISSAYALIDTDETRAKFDKGELDEKAARESRGRPGPFYHETQQGGGRYSSQFDGIDEDVLNSIFSQMGRRGPFEAPREDELYKMDIDFKDSILGAEREIALPSGKKFRVKIPGGIESGAKLRFAGKGDSGSDVYVQVIVQPSPVFKRVGKELEIEVPISLSEAILGGEIKVPTIDGSILLMVPPNISAGQKMRVGNKGVPYADGKRGAQIVKLNVQMPETIDEEFRKAVEAWSKRKAAETPAREETI